MKKMEWGLGRKKNVNTLTVNSGDITVRTGKQQMDMSMSALNVIETVSLSLFRK